MFKLRSPKGVPLTSDGCCNKWGQKARLIINRPDDDVDVAAGVGVVVVVLLVVVLVVVVVVAVVAVVVVVDDDRDDDDANDDDDVGHDDQNNNNNNNNNNDDHDDAVDHDHDHDDCFARRRLHAELLLVRKLQVSRQPKGLSAQPKKAGWQAACLRTRYPQAAKRSQSA